MSCLVFFLDDWQFAVMTVALLGGGVLLLYYSICTSLLKNILEILIFFYL